MPLDNDPGKIYICWFLESFIIPSVTFLHRSFTEGAVYTNQNSAFRSSAWVEANINVITSPKKTALINS